MRFKRMAVAASAAALIGGGGALQTAPAHAATPGDLALFGEVTCYWKGWGPNWDNLPGWRMIRKLSVRNIGGSDMHNVSITEVAGASRLVKVGSQPAGLLKANQYYYLVNTTVKGCWPSSISGYTIGQEVENPMNNYGIWFNVNQQNEQGQGSDVTPPDADKSGTGTPS
ncbi:MAG: hypothetical protein QM774_09345 [Gordonia sp. (in: high G+C Gram-positive bacteria)]|uniref:hypothetical protein n=1 Tax=Gordonia sp. (in: high G+C Gram-positive bacteria) TaxID=84139 RepID=UPI0039E4DC67